MSDQDFDLLVASLKRELRPRATSETSGPLDFRAHHWPWPARAQADRFWAVTVDRPLLYKLGTWGRIRGTLLAPIKLVLRKLIRWYVEPALSQQRDFNSSVLDALDQLNERVDAITAELERRPPG